MVLKEVIIKNFKSISDCNMTLEKGCRILVGVSESGKSNILNALSTLDPSVDLKKEMIKEGTRSNEDTYVKYVFGMDQYDLDELYDIFNESIYSSKFDKFIKYKGKSIKFKDFINKQYLYNIDIRNNKRTVMHYKLNNVELYEINDNHKFVDASIENKITIIDNNTGEEHILESKTIVNLSEYSVDENACSVCDIEKLYNYIVSISTNYIKNNIPNILFWEYKDEYLLPSSIIIEEFVNNPDINIPLKYIFNLCGIDDIKKEYKERKEMGEASFQNLLDEISKETNEYLKKVWKSMPKDCNLELRENADKINIRIKDANYSYLLNNRSDGFKRLITFMIMLSVKNKNDLLNNTLILIDEPETKIDIPGQDYLKAELINNIGINNYIFYSTHSTTMIDNNNIGRHYIVSKEKESSNIEEATEENYDNALTLYKALGMQIYAMINEKNIVFEGWTDTKYFKTGIKKLNTSLNKKFNNIGISHVPGATQFKNFASFWGLLSREYYIISDSDETSSGLKISFEKENYSGIWIKYDELTNSNIITCEDFLDSNYIQKKSLNFMKKYEYLQSINIEKLNTKGCPKVKTIEEWIRANEKDNSIVKKRINEFKTLLAEEVKKDDLTEDYILFLKNVIKKLNL